jgi:hypothetical protein
LAALPAKVGVPTIWLLCDGLENPDVGQELLNGTEIHDRTSVY